MKKYIIFIIGAFTIQSCMVSSVVSSNISEQYIKTNIQQHTQNEFNSMNLKTIYKSIGFEFVAFKTESRKGMLVRGNKYYNLPKQVESELIIQQEYDFVVLNITDLEDLLSKFETLSIMSEEISVKHPNIEEYVDYTVNDDFFISFRKDVSIKKRPNSINLWISELKYTMSSYSFKSNIEDAIKYLK